MAKGTITFETVREIGVALPGVEESTAYGSPALKVDGNIMACMAINRSAEPGTLGVWVDFEDRAELLAADPDVYYVRQTTTPPTTLCWCACLASSEMCCETCSAWPTGIAGSRGEAGLHGSQWFKVIRQPSGPLLGSSVEKKWGSRYNGDAASLCEGDSACKQF
jgi:hypothetical protein